MTAHLIPTRRAITLGILAGGAASRLGGIDKAWLERDGKPQVLHLVDALATAGRRGDGQRQPQCRALPGRTACARSTTGSADVGPIGGLDALAVACRSAWLLTCRSMRSTIPADLIER